MAMKISTNIVTIIHSLFMIYLIKESHFSRKSCKTMNSAINYMSFTNGIKKTSVKHDRVSIASKRSSVLIAV